MGEGIGTFDSTNRRLGSNPPLGLPPFPSSYFDLKKLGRGGPRGGCVWARRWPQPLGEKGLRPSCLEL
jgi:hypothetical protein